MGVIHTQKINGPAAWKASDFQNNSSWIRLLSKAEINELKAAVTGIKDRGLIFPHFTKTDFPLPIFSSKLAKYGYELETGYGFILLRGIPVDSYSDETDLDILYYGIGLHMGEPIRQNPQGDLIGRVINIGDLNDRKTRVYETNAHLPYHSDPSDLVGLLCIVMTSPIMTAPNLVE